MKLLAPLTLILALFLTAQASAQYYHANVRFSYASPGFSYAAPYGFSYYGASVYNGRYFSAGYYRSAYPGVYQRYGYGIDYGQPVTLAYGVPYAAVAVPQYSVAPPQTIVQPPPEPGPNMQAAPSTLSPAVLEAIRIAVREEMSKSAPAPKTPPKGDQ